MRKFQGEKSTKRYGAGTDTPLSTPGVITTNQNAGIPMPGKQQPNKRKDMLTNLAMGAMAGLAPGKAGQYLPLVIGGIQALRQMQQARAAKSAASQSAPIGVESSQVPYSSDTEEYKKGGRVMKGKTANTKTPQIPKGKQIPMPMKKGGMSKKGC